MAGPSSAFTNMARIFFVGILFIFALLRLQYLDFTNTFCSEIPKSKMNHAAPGECFYLKQQPYKYAILIHLACILPAAMLACLQFIPAIRRNAIRIHRIIGRIAIILSVVGTSSVFVLLPRTFGGGFGIFIIGSFIALAFLWALLMAYASVKRHHIEAHRAWMIRAWFWAGCIITQRVIQILLLKLASGEPPMYTMPCDKIDSMLQERTLSLYPECASFYSGENRYQTAQVRATLNQPTSVAEAAAGLDSKFGISLLLAFLIHMICVEIYLQITSRKDNSRRHSRYDRSHRPIMAQRDGW
ncbi:hypothetical protein F4678DRAFT_486077 [Xylaria arbuscula]|nr:hypothetical protein F4678DRAFT_486077 [Xylaria arbuscula]